MKIPIKKQHILSNRWLLTAAGSVLFVSIVLILLPVASKFYLTRWLLVNGADSAGIEKIRLNPFTGTASITGAAITTDLKTVFSDATVSLDIGMLSLLKKHIQIEKAVLDDVTLDVELYKDGSIRFGSYTTGPESNGPEVKTEKSASPWIILADHVTISNCRIRFRMENLDLTLQLDEGSLSGFTTTPGDTPGMFSLTGSVNGTPVTLDLNTLRIAPDIVARGRIHIDGFELDNLENFLKPYLTPFTGRVTVDGTGTFKRSDNGDLFADYEGIAGLEQVHVAGDSFSVRGTAVRWKKGPIHFADTKTEGIVIDVNSRLTGTDIAVDIPDSAIAIRESALALDGGVHVSVADEVRVESCAGLTLKQASFSLPSLQARAADVRWQGKEKCISFNSRAAVITANGRLTGTDLALDLADRMEYRQGAVTVEGRSEIELASQIKVSCDGILDLKETALEMEAVSGSGNTVSWQGKSELTLDADTGMQLLLDGTLKGTELTAGVRETGLIFNQNSIAITTAGSIAAGRETTIQGTASLLSEGFILQKKDRETPLVRLNTFSIGSIRAPGGTTVSIKKAEAVGLEVTTTGTLPLRTTVPSISVHSILTEDLAAFTVADVSIRSPELLATHNRKKLGGLGTLQIQGIRAGTAEKSITVDRINGADLFLLGQSTDDTDSLCRIDDARATKIGWAREQGLESLSLSLTGLYCNLIREEDGSLALNKQLAAMRVPGKTAEKSKEQPGQKKPAANIRLSQITLSGESGLHFEDHTLEVPFSSDLAITTLQVNNIDSGSPAEPASVKLIGTVDKRAPLHISGTIAPFGKSPAVKMKVKLKNYPLAGLSSYTVQSVGVALASGRLKLKSKIRLEDNQLDMNNEIMLKELETSTISADLAAKLDNQLPVPLDSALSMLRDSENNISLNIPLSGPVDELNVGISDILITALSKAIVPAASGYLMYTLGPYGALAWIGMKVGEHMLEIRLPPVEFSPGERAVPAELKDYFDRLALILRDRPDADFQLCPKSSAWEFIPESKRETLDEKGLELSDRDREKLMQLGQERAGKVKEYLINNYAIDKDRLLICLTRIETQKTAKSRVDIRM